VGGINIIVHDFTQKYEFSRGKSEQDDIIILKNNIVGCVDVIKTSKRDDKKGIDYKAYLAGGAELKIDAKNREKGASKFWKYGEPELALETWSAHPSKTRPLGKPGWTVDDSKEVDLILYKFDISDSMLVYLLPFQHLRWCFLKNLDKWISSYGEKVQFSNGWKSKCVFVPANSVIDAIQDISILSLGSLNNDKSTKFFICNDKMQKQQMLLDYV